MFCQFVMINFYKRQNYALQNEKKLHWDGEEMNIVEQAWMDKWNEVQSRYQAKLGVLSDSGQTQFADVLTLAQAAGANASASGAYPVQTAGTQAGTEASPTAYDSLIKQASIRYSVPESLIKSVIKTESGFNANAVSCCGAWA